MRTITHAFNDDIWPEGVFEVSVKWSREAMKRIDALVAERTPQFIFGHTLETVEPYVPLGDPADPKYEKGGRRPGDLIQSAHEYSYIDDESVNIVWSTPYAVRQFYENPGPTRPTGVLRGKHWTLRYLADGAGGLLNGLESEFGYETSGVLNV